MDITDFIPHGRENAISRDVLVSITGLSDRAVRKLIEDARQNCPVANLQTGDGYFIPDTIEDTERQLRASKNRAMSILKQQKALKKHLAEMHGQKQIRL